MNIPLANTDIVAVIDDADWELVRPYPWRRQPKRHTTYVIAEAPMVNGVKGKTLLMHRIIMAASPGEKVDHWDGNGLNNRRENLRLCTGTQNQWNFHGTRSVCGYRGVFLFKPTGRWRACIGFKGQRLNLGYFNSPVDAAIAYDAAAKKLRGEFARTNFGEGGLYPSGPPDEYPAQDSNLQPSLP